MQCATDIMLTAPLALPGRVYVHACVCLTQQWRKRAEARPAVACCGLLWPLATIVAEARPVVAIVTVRFNWNDLSSFTQPSPATVRSGACLSPSHETAGARVQSVPNTARHVRICNFVCRFHRFLDALILTSVPQPTHCSRYGLKLLTTSQQESVAGDIRQ